jgi:hypothetical protein
VVIAILIMILLLFQVVSKTILSLDHNKDSLDTMEMGRPEFEYSQIYVPDARDTGLRDRGVRLQGD